MKKTMISAVIAVLLAVGGYFGTNTTNPSGRGMSDLMLANAEALASEPEVTKYAKACISVTEDVTCATSPYSVFHKSTRVDDPDPSEEED